jgi:hypothetical protein
MNPRRKKAKGAARGPYQPSPRDIRTACDQIQQAWTVRERERRAGHSADCRWTPPSVNWSTLTDAAFEDQRADMTANSSV